MLFVRSSRLGRVSGTGLCALICPGMTQGPLRETLLKGAIFSCPGVHFWTGGVVINNQIPMSLDIIDIRH
jgi:hypothetical protein